MKTYDFWRLMDETHRRSGGDTERQTKLLILKLAAQGPEAVLKFEEHFRRFVSQAYERQHAPESALGRYGEFSDDGLEYFVNAIIAAGEEAYYKVLGAPYLFEIKDIYDEGGGEQIGWVPFYAYYRATGQPHPNFWEGDYEENDEYLLFGKADAPTNFVREQVTL